MRFQGSSSIRKGGWNLTKVILVILSLVCIAVGARNAYLFNIQDRILGQCMAGKSCPYQLDPLTLTAMLAAERSQFDIGVALAAIGGVAFIYFLVFFRARNYKQGIRKIAQDSPESNKEQQ